MSITKQRDRALKGAYADLLPPPTPSLAQLVSALKEADREECAIYRHAYETSDPSDALLTASDKASHTKFEAEAALTDYLVRQGLSAEDAKNMAMGVT